jgi:hypothetical protein
MTDPPAEPLAGDRQVRDFVEQLIGEATRPQCWVFLLDAGDRPLPVALPIDDLRPSADPDEATRLVGALEGIATGTGAAAVLLALERPGPQELTSAEAAWVRNLRRSFEGRRTRLRALVLVHDGGMRLLGPGAALAVAGSAFARRSGAG